MELKDTVSLMESAYYKDRFVAEVAQLRIRCSKLMGMVKSWDAGTLSFTPTCPRDMYDRQLKAMYEYQTVLEERAAIEGVDLSGIK